MKLVLISALLLYAATYIKCFPSGAPTSACSTVSPNTGSHSAQPRATPIPYTLDIGNLAANNYTPGQDYTLTLSGNSGEQFRGFLVQSRKSGGFNGGSFSNSGISSTTTQLLTCTSPGSSVTHTDRGDKSSVSFTWTAPSAGTGPVSFRFAVVMVRTMFWANQTTAVVQEQVAVDPPVIDTQPTNQLDVVSGADATFTVAATGVGLSYQWQRDNVDIANVADTYSGATTETLTVITAEEEDEGLFRCVVSNSGGTVTSENAQLTVIDIDPPVIDTQPTNQLDVVSGADATFTVAATGVGLSYQWQRDNVDIANVADTYSGATTETLTVITAEEEDEGLFRCVVSNSGGTVTSDNAQLTVLDIDIVITTQPVAQTNIIPGQDAVFSVAATSADTLNYQWQRDLVDLVDTDGAYSGATTDIVTVLSVAEADEGSFRCMLTVAAGSVFSNPAELTVLDPPVVTTPPVDQPNVDVGDNVTFMVAATGVGPFMYQWQRDGTDITDTADTYSGTTTSDLVVITVEEDDEGSFRCVVTNAAGSVTSNAADLTVGPDPTDGATRAAVLSLTVLLLAVLVAVL